MLGSLPLSRRLSSLWQHRGASPVIVALFVLVHLWLIGIVLQKTIVASDLMLYREWIQQGVTRGDWVGVGDDWVYPALAILPMLAVYLVSSNDSYIVAWLLAMALLNAVVVVVLLRQGRPARPAVTWWLVYLAVLGPLSLVRIDAVSVTLSLLAAAAIASRPWLAGLFLALATWTKVWPAVIIAALVITVRRRVAVILAGAAVTLVTVGVAWVIGAGAHVWGFLHEQFGRGLQSESTAAGILMVLPFGESKVEWIASIKTNELVGDGVAVVAAVLTPLMAVSAASILLVGVWAIRRGATAPTVLAPLVLTLVTLMILLNKVGSPQFYSWLAVPIVLGLLTPATARTFRTPALLALPIAAITFVSYPQGYTLMLMSSPIFGMALVVRGALLTGLVVLGVRAIVRAASRPASGAELERYSAPALLAEAPTARGPFESML